MAEREFPDIDADTIAAMAKAVAFEGYTVKDFAQITDDQMEACYAFAYNLVDQSRFDEAERLLVWLAGIDHYEAKYMVGVGICRQQMKQYESAVLAFATASVLDMRNPVPAIRAAECYMALGRLEEAESGLKAALHWSGSDARHAAVRDRAKVLMDVLNRRKGAGQ